MICAICGKEGPDNESNIAKRYIEGWSKHPKDWIWWLTCGDFECKNALDEKVKSLKNERT